VFSPPTGKRYAIACPNDLSAEAGRAAFERGGNAIDAALAAAASLTVTSPDNCALGGDAIALLREPDGEIVAVNGSGTAPAAVDVEGLRDRHGHTMPFFGPATITVPGVLAGWREIWSRGAALPWAEAFAAAIEQAHDGVPAARSVEAALDRDPGRLAEDPGMRRLFFPGGEPLRTGADLVQERLASSLEAVAGDGPGAFYDGPVGREWLRTMRDMGSPLSAGDLAGYAPEVTAAVAAEHRGVRTHTAPPNSQGVLLLMTLQLLASLEPGADPLSTQAPAIARAFQAAIEARDEYLADPRFADVPAEAIAGAHPDLTASPSRPARGGRGDTAAIVTADGEGRAVALIQSLFDSFGAGILDERTGIIAHNRGSFFSLDPRSPNVLEPGKRPAHTLTPVLQTEGDQLRSALGTMGGLAQTQVLTQVLLHLERGRPPAEAVDAPRWTVGGIEASASRSPVQAEGRVPGDVVDALAGAGWSIVRLSDYDFEAGEAQLIVRDRDGTFTAAGDPRGGGGAIAG
jgi:gamma-glutamyltranspeptidase / glutathione hydrolase